MKNEDFLNSVDNIKSIFTAVLLKKRIIPKDIHYGSPNFKGRVYDELKKQIDQIFCELPIDEITAGHLGLLISHVDNVLKLIAENRRKLKVEEKWQVKYIELFKRDLLKRLSEIEKKIAEEKDEEKSKTSLNRAETVLLMCYLQGRNLIDMNITDIEFTRAFSVLSGIKSGQLRKLLAGSNRQQKNLITEKKDSYLKLINNLQRIIIDIKEDMGRFILKSDKD